MKRILLTGATGFIGCQCIGPLNAHGYEVHAVSSRPVALQNEGATWHQADLLDQRQIAPLLEEVEPTHLLHLAWIVTPGKSYASPENFQWVQSSLTLAQEFVRVGGQRLVVCGTCYEYDQRYGLCHESRTPTAPDTLYGTCKNALRDLLTSFCAASGVSFAWPRLFFLYGPHEHPQRLVSSVICSLLRGEQARCSHGRQLRDYLYVEDAAEALAAIAESDLVGTVNIGQGAPVSLQEIVHGVAIQIGRPDLLALGAIAARPNEVPLIAADITRLTNEVGWQPRFLLAEGIARTIAWWRSELSMQPVGSTHK
ncbi:MAG: NAD-dependent epimerase/dehydratase family protein [Thermoguttaceae bacterium]